MASTKQELIKKIKNLISGTEEGEYKYLYLDVDDWFMILQALRRVK